MKKNGFAFVETIVSVVILASVLLLLYTTFNKTLQIERTRVYYDDINYIYRTWYLKEQVKSLNFDAVINELNNDNSRYYLNVGSETESLFHNFENKKTYISDIVNDFDVVNMIVVKENKLDDIKKCVKSTSIGCIGLSQDMIIYLGSIYVEDIPSVYVYVVEYESCNENNENCHNFYSWVSV